MPTANKLHVIGIGYRPLEKRAKEIVAGCGRHSRFEQAYEVFQRYDEYQAVKDRIKVINKVPDTIAFIREQPFTDRSRTRSFFLPPAIRCSSASAGGCGEEFGKERVEILPDLSSMQEAFARINEPWDDAFFMSLHGGPDIAKRRKLPYEIADIPSCWSATASSGY